MGQKLAIFSRNKKEKLAFWVIKTIAISCLLTKVLNASSISGMVVSKIKECLNTQPCLHISKSCYTAHKIRGTCSENFWKLVDLTTKTAQSKKSVFYLRKGLVFWGQGHIHVISVLHWLICDKYSILINRQLFTLNLKRIVEL